MIYGDDSERMADATFFLTPHLHKLRWHLRMVFHRCACCHARNRSLDQFPSKDNAWLCGECVFFCDGDCAGIPWRRQNHT